MTKGKSCKRSHAPFTDEHLKRLAAKARADQQSLFERKPHLAVYGPRLLLIALCQGGATHYLDCRKGKTHTNGVKDLDVYTFYSKDPGIKWNDRRHVVVDFGESEFGYHPDRKAGYVGRHVDLLSRALAVEPDANPVMAVQDWLANSHNKTPNPGNRMTTRFATRMTIRPVSACASIAGWRSRRWRSTVWRSARGSAGSPGGG